MEGKVERGQSSKESENTLRVHTSERICRSHMCVGEGSRKISLRHQK